MLQQHERALPGEVVRQRVVVDAVESELGRIRIGEPVPGGAEDRDLVVGDAGVAELLVQRVDVGERRVGIPGAAVRDDVRATAPGTARAWVVRMPW